MDDLIQKQKLFWDTVAINANTISKTSFPSQIFNRLIKKSARILQYGCGRGITLFQLFEMGYKNIYGIDHSEKMIEQAQKINPHLSVNLAVCKSLDVPFLKNYFDVVILNSLLTCLVKNEQQHHLLRKIETVLKPDGVLFICDYFITPEEYDVKRYKKYRQNHPDEPFGIFESSDGILFRHHDPVWIIELTRNFEQIEFNEIKCATMHNRTVHGFYYIGLNQKK